MRRECIVSIPDMYIEDSSIDIVDVITDNIIQHTHRHTHIKREASYRYRCRCNNNNNNNITSKYQLVSWLCCQIQRVINEM